MNTIHVIPLSTPQTITLAARDALYAAKKLYLQTTQTPCIQPSLLSGLSYETMDGLYESCEDFDALALAIAERLAANAPCAYAVPGDGCFAQLPVITQIAGERGIAVQVLPGVSYAKAAFPSVQEGLYCTAGNLPAEPDTERRLLIQELHSFALASDVKLWLLEYYPAEHPVEWATMDAEGAYHIKLIPLHALDRQKFFHATVVLGIPPLALLQKERHAFGGLLPIMRRLCAPGGCPWDREQTHQSLKRPLLEECYELLDAIDSGDDAALVEELGDVLLQVAFHAVIGEEQGRFSARDIGTAIAQKLIYRHPHIFGYETAHTADEVMRNWDALKEAEKGQATVTDTLRAVPRNFPALVRAQKVQKRAAKVGFDWDSAQAACAKLPEETAEFEAALWAGTNVREELGDLFFTLVNITRLLGFDAEEVMHMGTQKFICRFAEMEKLARQNGEELRNMTFARQNELWELSKKTQLQ